MFRVPIFKSVKTLTLPSLRFYRPTTPMYKGRPIYKEQQMQKNDPVKLRVSQEEKMQKRFIKDRQDAEFGEIAQREFNKYSKSPPLIFRNEESEHSRHE